MIDIYIVERIVTSAIAMTAGKDGKFTLADHWVFYIMLTSWLEDSYWTEENYPAIPSKGLFCTPVFHPNLNRHGRICHSILDSKY